MKKNVFRLLFLVFLSFFQESQSHTITLKSQAVLQDFFTEPDQNTIQRSSINIEEKDPCSDLIKISAIKFSSATAYSDWKTTYAKYLSLGTPSSNEPCGNDFVWFNALHYVMDLRDYSKEKLAKWLHDNQSYICFEDTYEMIECAHRIQDEKLIRLIAPLFNGAMQRTQLSFNDISTKVSQKGGNYSNPNYNQYLNFEFEWDGTINFHLSKTYKPNGDFYSIPLFKSIQAIYGSLIDNNADCIEFITVPVKGGLSQILFSVKLSDGKIVYYDYSQIPPTSGGIETFYYFSPL